MIDFNLTSAYAKNKWINRENKPLIWFQMTEFQGDQSSSPIDGRRSSREIAVCQLASRQICILCSICQLQGYTVKIKLFMGQNAKTF